MWPRCSCRPRRQRYPPRRCRGRGRRPTSRSASVENLTFATTRLPKSLLRASTPESTIAIAGTEPARRSVRAAPALRDTGLVGPELVRAEAADVHLDVRRHDQVRELRQASDITKSHRRGDTVDQAEAPVEATAVVVCELVDVRERRERRRDAAVGALDDHPHVLVRMLLGTLDEAGRDPGLLRGDLDRQPSVLRCARCKRDAEDEHRRKRGDRSPAALAPESAGSRLPATVARAPESTRSRLVANSAVPHLPCLLSAPSRGPHVSPTAASVLARRREIRAEPRLCGGSATSPGRVRPPKVPSNG